MFRLCVLAGFLCMLLTQTQGWKYDPCRTTALGMKTGAIKDKQITASSFFNNNHRPSRARLTHKGAWAAKRLDRKQYLQINLGEISYVTGIKTQGRSDASQWVTSYQVWSSIGGALYSPFRVGPKRLVAVFKGNSDSNTIVSHSFQNPNYLIGQYIRILPVSWHGWISMRVEIMGCPQSARVRLKCYSDRMVFSIPQNMLIPLKPTQMQLSDPKCRPKMVIIGGIKYYQFMTGLNKCGTVCYTTANYIHYVNIVSQVLAMSGSIYRYRRVRIPFSCSYSSVKVMTTVGFHPNVGVLEFSEHQLGLFPCYLFFYKSIKYITKLRPVGPPLPIGLGYRVFVELTFICGDPHLVIKAQDCWATPSKNPAALPGYALIKNGIAVDPTVLFHPTKPKSRQKQRWSFKAFVLMKHHKYIFVHCRIRICKDYVGFCRVRPGKRSLAISDDARADRYTHMVTQGPILVQDTPSQSDTPKHDKPASSEENPAHSEENPAPLEGKVTEKKNEAEVQDEHRRTENSDEMDEPLEPRDTNEKPGKDENGLEDDVGSDPTKFQLWEH